MFRREFFSLSAGVTALSLPNDVLAEKIGDDPGVHATRLAESMKLKYGGEWRVNIEPEHGFIVVVRDS